MTGNSTKQLVQPNGKISRTKFLRILKDELRPIHTRIDCDPYAGENLQLLKRAAKNGFKLYCKCESLEEADRLIASGVYVYMDETSTCKSQATPGGKPMVPLSVDDPTWGDYPREVVLVLKN